MTVVSAIPIMAYMLARSFLWGSRGGGNKNAGAIIVVAIVSFVIYLISQLLVMRLSRLREYYADSYSAFVTNDPHALSSALAKISYGLSMAQKNTTGVRAFYIGDPSNAKREIGNIMKKKSKYDLDGNGVLDERELELAMEKEAESNSWTRANELFSTHPSTFRRILNLKHIEEELAQSGQVPKDIYKHI
jgi:heat shock protein HtpX